MIRKNVASQVIYLPALLLTADGSAVTSGATMTVSKDGTEAASAGTLAHSTGGVWKYTPTQGETNCAIMALILTATSAVPVVVNLVTTAADTSAVALGAMVSYTQPTGFLAATFPTTVASTTNITAGTITTTTNLTNLPAITAGWITADGIAAEAITDAKVASDVTIASVTGAVGSVTGNVGGNVVGSVGSVTGLTAANLDVAVSTLATQASVNTIDDFLDTEVAAIKAKTDQLTFTVANQVDSNALSGGGGLDAAGVRAAVGLASANLDTQLTAIDDLIDTEVGAIKAKTDQMVFTVANQLDANALTGGSGLDAAGVRAAVGLASANLDTQLADLPTNAELSAALAAADDAVLAAVGTPMQAGSTVVLTDGSLTTAKLGTFALAKTTNLTGFNDLSASGIRTAVGLTTNNLGPYLDTLTTYADDADVELFSHISPVIDAIKVKTDQMVFTVANQLDANALSGGGGGLDAAQTRAALGLASANLDTQLADIPTVSEFNARTIAAASYFDPAVDTVIVGSNNDKTGYSLTQSFPTNFASLGINASGHVTRVVLVDTTTTNTDMRGTDGANTTTPPTAAQIRTEMDSSSTQLAAIVADTNELQTDWANGGRLDLIVDSLSTQASVNDLPTNAELATALGTADDATLAAVAAVKADTLIAKNASVVILGTIANAGSATEQYTYGGITVTYAGLDEDGNRSGVTIT